MRAVSLHADVIVVASRVWQTTSTLVRGRGRSRAFVIDSPVTPTSWRSCRRCSSRRASRSAGCSPPTATGITCSARLAFPDAALGVRRDDRGPPGRGAGRGRAGAARVRRRALRRPPRAARARLGAGAAGPGRAASSGAASWSCTRPTATPSTAWRSGSRGPASRLRRLPLAGGDPDVAEGSPRGLPGDAGAAAPARARGRARRPRPRGRARRARRWRSWRGSRLPRAGCSQAALTRRCRGSRRSAAQRRRHAENVAALAGSASRAPRKQVAAGFDACCEPRSRAPRRGRAPRVVLVGVEFDAPAPARSACSLDRRLARAPCRRRAGGPARGRRGPPASSRRRLPHAVAVAQLADPGGRRSSSAAASRNSVSSLLHQALDAGEEGVGRRPRRPARSRKLDQQVATTRASSGPPATRVTLTLSPIATTPRPT